MPQKVSRTGSVQRGSDRYRIVTFWSNLGGRPGRVYASQIAGHRSHRCRRCDGAGFAAGDAGFAEFYHGSYPRIVTLVAVLLGDQHEAQDVAQEAFARALGRWLRLRKYDVPEAWVRKVAFRLAVDTSRRTRRRRLLPARLAAGADHSPTAHHANPADQLGLGFSSMATALAALPMASSAK